VIHGDLKSGNVILSKSSDGTTRAAITDFGMARARETSQGTVQSGPRGGTPDYMAPELCKGERATFVSDVYALGVLLQELSGDDASAFPKSILAKCLAQDPRDRYASAGEVVQALEPSHTRRWVLLAAVAALVVVLTGVVTYQRATAPKEVVRLAMLPFSYDSALRPLADPALRETSANLAKLTGDKRARYSAVGLQEAQSRNVGSPEQAKGILGATHVLQGTLAKENGQILLHAVLTDTRTGVNVKDWKIDYAPDQLRYIPIALAGFVTGSLHLPPLSYRAINSAAQVDYNAGTALLRHDATVDEAIAAFQRAVDQDPDSPLAYAGLAEAQWLKNSISRKRVWYDLAMENLKQAQKRDMDLPRVLFVGGTLNMLNSRYEQSVEDLTRAIELDPAYSDAYRHLARVFELNGQLDQALTSFRRAVDVDPEYYRAHLNLGQFFIRREQDREALPSLRRAVDLASEEPDVRYPLGLALMNLGQFPDAESQMRAGLARGETPIVLNGLATTLMYQREEKDAIPLLTRALELNPRYYLALRNLGICNRRLHHDKEADQANVDGLALAKAAVQINPKFGSARSFVAYFHARLRHRQEAELEIDQAKTFSTDGSEVLWMAVLTYEALGDRQATMDALRAAPAQLLGDLSRWPDLEGLHNDKQFVQLLVSKHVQ
jgi:tetratricopeptide (TPR) repeat protein